MQSGRLLVLIVAALAGCTFPNWEKTQLQQQSPFWLDVHAISDWRHVERTARNAVRLAPDALVGMRVVDRTDGIASAEFVVPTDDGIVILLGTTPHNVKSRADSGHVLRIGHRASTLTMRDGTTHQIDAGIPAATPTIVAIENNGRAIRVSVGCAKPLTVTTRQPSTEWILVHAPAGCALNDPELDVLYPNQTPEGLRTIK
jgi:hypothetical protein